MNNGHGHRRVVCSCGVVLEQCRCPALDKSIVISGKPCTHSAPVPQITFDERIKKSLAKYLRERGLHVETVVHYRDDTESSGGCETCYFEYAVVKVDYIDLNGKKRLYTIESSFADLIRNLTD